MGVWTPKHIQTHTVLVSTFSTWIELEVTSGLFFFLNLFLKKFWPIPYRFCSYYFCLHLPNISLDLSWFFFSEIYTNFCQFTIFGDYEFNSWWWPGVKEGKLAMLFVQEGHVLFPLSITMTLANHRRLLAHACRRERIHFPPSVINQSVVQHEQQFEKHAVGWVHMSLKKPVIVFTRVSCCDMIGEA